MIAINRVTKVVKAVESSVSQHSPWWATATAASAWARASRRKCPLPCRRPRWKARRNLFKGSIKNGTLHYECTAITALLPVVMCPALAGTGIIAGGPMRAVFEVMGITDIVAKSHGSSNPYNMVRATLERPEATARDRVRKWLPKRGLTDRRNLSPERKLTRKAEGKHSNDDATTTLKVQLVKSPIGTKESHRATVRGSPACASSTA